MKANNYVKISNNCHEVIKPDGTRILYSYATAVAACLPTGEYVRTDVTYSETTNRHVHKWCPANCAAVPQSTIDALT